MGNFLLHHFYLLYASLILFSSAELITGLFLKQRHPPDGWSIQPRARRERACQD
jgi:hypothetical protein